jgi:hypothetical protein
MRRIERITAVPKAFGEVLGERRLSNAVVLGLSAVALQAAALERPSVCGAQREETSFRSATDLDDGAWSPTTPPPWCAPAFDARPAIPMLGPVEQIAKATEADVRPAPWLIALHPLRGPPHRFS